MVATSLLPAGRHGVTGASSSNKVHVGVNYYPIIHSKNDTSFRHKNNGRALPFTKRR